jgi:hypothetical protein
MNGAPQGLAVALLRNVRLGCKVSLGLYHISDEEKSFITLTPIEAL